MLDWLNIFCSTVDSDHEFCARLGDFIHMISFDTVSIMDTMWQTIGNIHPHLVPQKEK